MGTVNEKIKIRGLAVLSSWIFILWGGLVTSKGFYDLFIGEEHLSMLAKLKSKKELIGEVIGLLQSPAKNVVSALQSGGQTLSGLVKTLSER